MTEEPHPPEGPEADAQDTRRLRAAMLAVATVFFAVVPFVVPFDGFDPELYPVPQEDPPAQPAGYAFAIWGPIYLWLLAHGIFGLFARADDPVWDAPRLLMILSLAVGAAWLPVASFSPVWATILIWVMLITALLALLVTDPARDRWLLRAPIALYAGWLTAASWVAIALLGAGYGLGPEATGWAWVALAGALVTAMITLRISGPAPFYAAGVIWALIGVAIANWGESLPLSLAALAGAALLAAEVLRALRNRASDP